MPREIKFRAWDKDKQIITTVEGISFSGIIFGDGEMTIKNHNGFWDRKERYELMQYTGLKDKNGKEIYEGDVIRNKLKIRVVTFEDGSFHAPLVVEDEHIGINKILLSHSFLLPSCEVIGNIFQDSHLLDNKYESNKRFYRLPRTR